MSIGISLFSPVPQAGAVICAFSAASTEGISASEVLGNSIVHKMVTIENESDMANLNTDFVFGRMEDGDVIKIRRNGRLRPFRNKIFQVPNDGKYTKATDENGRVYSIETGKIADSGACWGIAPKYVERFGRKYDSSGDHNNVKIFIAGQNNSIRTFSQKEVRALFAKCLGISFPKFDSKYVKDISLQERYHRVSKVSVNGKKISLYVQDMNISVGMFRKKVKIVIEAKSVNEFKKIKKELIDIIRNAPSSLLGNVRIIEIYQEESTLYGLDVSKEPIGGHCDHAAGVVRIFDFKSLEEHEKIMALRHELWHSLIFERDKAYVLLAIKAGGKGAEKELKRYSEISFAEHHQDSWSEYAATAGGMLLYLGPDSEYLLNGLAFIVSALTYLAAKSFVSTIYEKGIDVG